MFQFFVPFYDYYIERIFMQINVLHFYWFSDKNGAKRQEIFYAKTLTPA